jgi:ABC-type polysaccharide/polyol phosphate export permease
MTVQFRELSAYRELLWNLVLTELKLRYRDSILGFLWTILNPLFSLLILSFVFSRIMRYQVPNYTIFLFSGLASWFMIQQSVVIAVGSIVNNQSLIKKIYIPKIVFPLSNVLARFVDHGVLLVLLLGFMPVFGVRMGWSLLFLPVAVVLHFAFALGLSLLLATAQVRVRDIQNVAGIVFQAFFYLTPIIYPLEVLPEGLRPYFVWNPFYLFVRMIREPVWGGVVPEAGAVVVAAGLAAAALALGLWVFGRKEKYFVYYLS